MGPPTTTGGATRAAHSFRTADTEQDDPFVQFTASYAAQGLPARRLPVSVLAGPLLDATEGSAT